MQNCVYKWIIIIVYLVFLNVSLHGEQGAESLDNGQISLAEEVTLKIMTTPPYAKIYINSAYYGISPLTTKVAAYGDYTIEAQLHEQVTTAHISIADEKLTEVSLKFAPEPLNIVAFIILFVLTVLGALVFGRVRTKEAKYSSIKRMYSKK
jgi:hypothetical protein